MTCIFKSSRATPSTNLRSSISAFVSRQIDFSALSHNWYGSLHTAEQAGRRRKACQVASLTNGCAERRLDQAMVVLWRVEHDMPTSSQSSPGRISSLVLGCQDVHVHRLKLLAKFQRTTSAAYPLLGAAIYPALSTQEQHSETRLEAG